MSKKQIKRDLEELYIGKNTEDLVKEYYQKKKKEMLLLFLAGILGLVLVFVKDFQESKLSQNNTVIRNENGKGKKELSLEVKIGEGQWQDFVLELQEREYGNEELEVLFSDSISRLPDLILGQNETLECVTEDLNLIQEIEGTPFLLLWDSSRPEIIDSGGHIEQEMIPLEGIDAELKVCFKYEEWNEETVLEIRLNKNNENRFIHNLIQKLRELEKENRKELQLQLPQNFEKNLLQWRYKRENTVWFLAGLFLMILPLIAYQKDRELHNLVQKRREELLRQYPEFISKLILYMEAGMTINGAIYKIAEDYRKKRKKGKKSSYLYEEIVYVCRKNKNGLSEEESYQLLGTRCNLPCYRKLTTLLIQHLKKGGYGTLEILRSEVDWANEERKKQIKKQGEEMGTKLLVPMILMLGIVMVLIMVPACFSFQI